MIVLTLKSHASRTGTGSRFHNSAVAPRPTQSSSSSSPSPASATVSAPAPAPAADSTYLRRWVTHQATTYNDLLKTIAAAPIPAPHGKRG